MREPGEVGTGPGVQGRGWPARGAWVEDWQLGRGLNKAGRRPRGGNGRVRGKDTEVSHPVPLPPSSTFHPQPLAQLPPRMRTGTGVNSLLSAVRITGKRTLKLAYSNSLNQMTK